MPKPLLNLGDIGIVGESVRCRCSPQRINTEAVDLGADARSRPYFLTSDKLLDQDSGGTEGRAFKVMKSKTAVTVRLLDFMEAMKAEKILASLPGF